MIRIRSTHWCQSRPAVKAVALGRADLHLVRPWADETGRCLLREAGLDATRLPVVIRYDGQTNIDPSLPGRRVRGPRHRDARTRRLGRPGWNQPADQELPRPSHGINGAVLMQRTCYLGNRCSLPRRRARSAGRRPDPDGDASRSSRRSRPLAGRRQTQRGPDRAPPRHPRTVARRSDVTGRIRGCINVRPPSRRGRARSTRAHRRRLFRGQGCCQTDIADSSQLRGCDEGLQLLWTGVGTSQRCE
jgi:hypothetical protein